MPTIPQLPVGDKAAAPDAPIGNPLAEGLPPPTEAQIKEFFGKRSAVIPLGVPTDHSGPAVYFIRHQGGDPVQRWMGRDDCRILYIGSSGTGKSNMAARSRQMQAGNHGAVIRIGTLERQCETYLQLGLEYQYFFVKMDDIGRAKFWESYILLSYYYQFGDRPPLNRKLEYCYLKSPHNNDGYTVLRWPFIRNMLLAVK